MNTSTAAEYQFRQSQLVQFFRASFKASPTLILNAAAMLLGFVLCAVLLQGDPRTFNGINIWLKPGKFFFSMCVHLLTTAWALTRLTSAERKSRPIKMLIGVLLAAAWAELLYIAFQASQGQASHFNASSTLYASLYMAMAVLSVVLVLAPAILGWIVWRKAPHDEAARFIALGFGLAAVVTVAVGMTLGSHSSHWIGGDMTDATGLPIFKWSTTGGDLRVAHFIGLHIMQAVPFAAVVSGRRSVAYATAIFMVALTTFTFVQALMGVPLLKV